MYLPMSPFEDVRKEIVKRSFGRLFDDVVGYLNLYDFLKLKAIDLTGKSKAVSLNTFWFSILGDRFASKTEKTFRTLKSGDSVKLKDVFLSEWIPKMPGQIWTSQGVAELREGQRRIAGYARLKSGGYTAVIDPHGKEKSLSAGLGSVRMNPNMRSASHCTCLGLVDLQNWQTDRALPVIVSRSAYKRFKKYSEYGAVWVKELQGVLHLNEDLPLKTFIPKAIGAELSQATEESLRFRPNLPKAFIYVSSPLSLKLGYHDAYPLTTAWTMFETRQPRNPYRYTYFTFYPSTEENFSEATQFLRDYATNYDGKKIVTDYDGVVPRLEAAIPITSNPITTKKKEARELILRLDEWARQTLRKLDFPAR